MDSVTTARSAADLEAVIRADAQRGYQVASLIAPPAYIILSLVRRRGVSVNKTLRATWVAGAGGAGAGAVYGWAEGFNSPAWLKDRHQAIAYDVNRIRADDHSTIGAILFGVLTPALLWKRARAVHLILGGAGIGSAVGLSTHLWRTFTESQVTVPAPTTPPSPVSSPVIPVEKSAGRSV